MTSDDLKIAKVLQHEMYKHIHDDNVNCSKCESKGFIVGHTAALNSEAVQGLVDASDRLMDICGVLQYGLGGTERDKAIRNFKKQLEKFQQFKDGKDASQSSDVKQEK